MESLQFLAQGFATALSPQNLMFAILGSVFGTLIGVLPGVGPAAGTAMLLPLTFSLPPTPAIIMLAAIYYGAMYGGTITSVLMSVPGEAASVVTCMEGHAMAKAGRAGPALAIAAIGSFVGGSFATACLVLIALPLARAALTFGPPEFFGLMVFGISLVMGLAGKSVSKALLMGLFGLALSQVGLDPMVARPRFAFGNPMLSGGVEMVAVVMGLFGVADLLSNVEKAAGEVTTAKIKNLMPTREDWRRSILPIVRGTGIGTFLGLIPGVGAVVPTFMTYVAEKKANPRPKEGWGNGVIEGVAGPETANNAYSNAALIPLFTLGIPGSPTVAILMGAFMMNGLTPGPFLFTEHADIAWAVVASLYIGNLILVILNLPLVGLWVKVLQIPQGVLYAVILTFCIIGAYSLNSRTWDIGVMLLFGALGYLLKKLDYPLAPLILTLVLGPMMEQGLAQGMMMSRGDPSIFVTRPIALGLLILAVAFLALSARGALNSEVRQETEL